MSVGGGVNRDPEPAPNTPRSSPNPHQTPEPSENHVTRRVRHPSRRLEKSPRSAQGDS